MTFFDPRAEEGNRRSVFDDGSWYDVGSPGKTQPLTWVVLGIFLGGLIFGILCAHS